MQFRPEIEGLRALSVMLVILHHLGVPFVSGGYVGVDVFFVISGYLITHTLISESQQGGFSIGGFYKKRIIRLAPAYFAVITIVTVVGAVMLLPSELTAYAKSALAATFFLANVFMWKETGGYFGESAETIPLLHLWSLAVEEQFYIFWPIIILMLLSFVRPKHYTILVLSIVVLGVVASEWAAQNTPVAAYFLMPMRAFELLIGAALIFLPVVPANAKLKNIATLLGIGLIFLSAISFSKKTNFPGINALVPCLGAALIIYFSSKEKGVGKLLSSRPCVFLGKLSYPAYLWHWPIIAFLNIYDFSIDIDVGLFVIIATFSFAWFTFKYIETPSKRLNQYSVSHTLAYGFCVPALIVIVIVIAIINSDGYKDRFDIAVISKDAALHSHPNKIRADCFGQQIPHPEDCILGIHTAKIDFLLVGDSFANHWTGMIDVFARDAKVRGFDITMSNGIFLPETRRFYTERGQRTEHLAFARKNQEVVGLIRNRGYSAVILGGNWTAFLSRGDFVELDGNSAINFKNKLESAIQIIIESGAKPYIIVGNPTLPVGGEKCSLRNLRINKNENCTVPRIQWEDEASKWRQILFELTTRYPDLALIDTTDVMCSSMVCNTELRGIPLYRDPYHLNDLGSRLLGEIYLEKFMNPLSVLGR